MSSRVRNFFFLRSGVDVFALHGVFDGNTYFLNFFYVFLLVCFVPAYLLEGAASGVAASAMIDVFTAKFVFSFLMPLVLVVVFVLRSFRPFCN